MAGRVNRELTWARLQLLITTRLNSPCDNTQIWQADTNQLLAAVFLLQRGLGRPLELTYSVDPHTSQLSEAEIFHWALTQAVAVGKEQQSVLPLVVLLGENAHASIALL